MNGATSLFLFNDDYDKHHRPRMLLNKPKEMKQLFERVSERLLELLIPVFPERFCSRAPFGFGSSYPCSRKYRVSG